MILAIDIGNSTIKFGVFRDEKLVTRFSIPTIRKQSAEEIQKSIEPNLKSIYKGIIISSVVPELNESFRILSENYFNSPALFVDHSFDFGLINKYSPPASVGIDRLIAASGARQKYGSPCIVCDFGTATNIEVVNSKNEYLGGIITAGMNLLADSLHQRTSKLPQIELRKPEKVIGNSTVSAIQSGVYNGYTELINGLIDLMIKELGEKPKIIGTGGLVKIIAESTKKIEIIDENLMLESLRNILEKHLKTFN